MSLSQVRRLAGRPDHVVRVRTSRCLSYLGPGRRGEHMVTFACLDQAGRVASVRTQLLAHSVAPQDF